MNITTLEDVCSFFYACFQNARIIRVYPVASGLGMFYRWADIPFQFQTCVSPPSFPTSFALSNIIM